MKNRYLFLTALIAGLLFWSCDSTSAAPGTDATPTPTATPTATATPTSTPTDGGEYRVLLNFSGPSVSPAVVYVAWIENENGNNLQNLYICNSVLGIGKTLTGVALPYWHTEKYSAATPDDFPPTDGLTGASTQVSKTISRDLSIGSETKFRLCFEIDRSLNANEYFTDRPSFIYKSEVIDLSALKSSYSLPLVAFMPNATLDGTWSQKPRDGKTVTGFAAYAYLTDLTYIAPIDDMVTGLSAEVSAQ